MRKVTTVATLFTWTFLLAATVRSDEIPSDVGKLPEEEVFVQKPPVLWPPEGRASSQRDGPTVASRIRPRGQPPDAPEVKEDPGPTETPNQERRRMGLPIEASYPAPEYGSAETTPNQLRKQQGLLAEAKEAPIEYGATEKTPNQLRREQGQPIVASYPTEDYGVLEETPNQQRERLMHASQTVIATTLNSQLPK